MSESSQSGITTWRCALNQSFPHLKCRAKAYTKQFGSVQRVKLSSEEHTHPASTQPNGGVERKKKKPKVKKKVFKKPKKVT